MSLRINPEFLWLYFHFSLFIFHLLLVRFSFAFPSLLVRSLEESRMGGKWDLQRTCIGLTWEVHINELWKVSFLFHLINEKILLKLYDYHLFAVTLQKIKTDPLPAPP